MSEPKFEPCPNPECPHDSDCATHNEPAYPKAECNCSRQLEAIRVTHYQSLSRYQVWCENCDYHGPEAKSEAEAIRLHNLICRPEGSGEPVTQPVAWMVPHIIKVAGSELEGMVGWSPSVIGDATPVTDKHGVTHRPYPLYRESLASQTALEPSKHEINWPAVSEAASQLIEGYEIETEGGAMREPTDDEKLILADYSAYLTNSDELAEVLGYGINRKAIAALAASPSEAIPTTGQLLQAARYGWEHHSWELRRLIHEWRKGEDADFSSVLCADQLEKLMMAPRGTGIIPKALLEEAPSAAIATSGATDAEIKAWAERHNLMLTMTDLRCAFEDAETLHLVSAPPDSAIEMLERLVKAESDSELMEIAGEARIFLEKRKNV